MKSRPGGHPALLIASPVPAGPSPSAVGQSPNPAAGPLQTDPGSLPPGGPDQSDGMADILSQLSPAGPDAPGPAPVHGATPKGTKFTVHH